MQNATYTTLDYNFGAIASEGVRCTMSSLASNGASNSIVFKVVYVDFSTKIYSTMLGLVWHALLHPVLWLGLRQFVG